MKYIFKSIPITITTGLKALAYTKIMADYDKFLQIQKENYEKEQNENNINELLITNFYDIIVNIGIVSITSYCLYYLCIQ